MFLEAWSSWKRGTITTPRFLRKLQLATATRREQSTETEPSDLQRLRREVSALESELQEINEALRIIIQELNEYTYDRGDGRPDAFDFTSALIDWAWYTERADEVNSNTDTSIFTQKVSVVITLITNVGMVVSVLMSAFMGIKYMLGSIEEKVELKKDLIPYLVGAILLFGISAIVKVMLEIGKSINNS